MTVATTTGEVRKELYAYLEASGFDLTEQRHATIKKFIMEHTRIDNEKVKDRLVYHSNALSNAGIPPKIKTIHDRLEGFKCAICGIPMVKRSEYEYITDCPHLKGIAFCYA